MTSGIHVSCNITLLWHLSLNMHIHGALIGVRQSICFYINLGMDALLWFISPFLTHSHRDHRQTGLLRLREDELTVTVTAQVWTCASREASLPSSLASETPRPMRWERSIFKGTESTEQ